jgi:hypothetical protein
MFINNKYTRWYDSIVNKAKNSNRNKKDGYFEAHHIIPKCVGGTETVLLTAKEHFICHWLLVKMVNTKKHYYQMANAINKMRANNSHQKRNYTSAQYEVMKKYASINAHHSLCSPVIRKKMKDNHPSKKDNYVAPFSGKKHSLQTKMKMSTNISKSKKGKGWSEQQKNILTKKYLIEGKVFMGMEDISRAHNFTKQAVYYRIHSKNFPNWTVVGE